MDHGSVAVWNAEFGGSKEHVTDSLCLGYSFNALTLFFGHQTEHQV